MSVVATHNVRTGLVVLSKITGADPMRYALWPGPLLAVPIVADLVRALWYRPVRVAVVLVAGYTAIAYAWWAGLLLLVSATVWDRFAGSHGWAASGPWLRSYRRCQVRGKLRRRWAHYMRDSEAVDAAHRPPPHTWIRRTPTGIKTKVRHGQVAVTYEELADAQVCSRIAGMIGNVHSVRFRKLDEGRSEMYVNLVNPLAGIIPWQSMPAAAFPRVTLGRAAEGHWYQPQILGLHIKVVGASGAGKSSLVWDIIGGAEQWEMPPQWYVLDKPGGIELPALDQALGGIATEYERDPRLADKLFQKMAEEAERRNEIMRRYHWKKWDPNRAEALGPLVFGLVDELLTLPKKATREGSWLRQLLTVGRASGVQVIATTQLPQRDEGGMGRLADLFTFSIVGSTDGPGMTASALGDAAVSKAPAHELALPNDAGIFYAKEEGVSGYTRFKAGFVDDDHGQHLPIGRGQLRKTSSKVGRLLDEGLAPIPVGSWQ